MFDSVCHITLFAIYASFSWSSLQRGYYMSVPESTKQVGEKDIFTDVLTIVFSSN